MVKVSRGGKAPRGPEEGREMDGVAVRVARECRRAFAKYIETHYNRIRRCASPGYLTPAAYRAGPLTPFRISPIPEKRQSLALSQREFTRHSTRADAMRGVLSRVAGAAAAAMIWTWLSISAAAAGETVRVAVLDTYGVWRMHCTLAPPVLASGETVRLRYAWLNYKTAEPAQGWQHPNFDDGTWLRGPATLACKTALLSKVCLRGKFTVTDPAVVQGLALWVAYRGGLVVSVNGQELKREYIAPKAALAEGPAGEERTLPNLPIPVELLRKGMNLIGLEVVRAGYPERTEDDIYEDNSCEILGVRLTSKRSTGLTPNATRPQGFQVWNADVMAADYTVDFGDAAEALRQ